MHSTMVPTTSGRLQSQATNCYQQQSRFHQYPRSRPSAPSQSTPGCSHRPNVPASFRRNPAAELLAATARFCFRVHASSVTDAPSTSAPATKLIELTLEPVVNRQGMVFPDVPEGMQASVFAVYDSRQKLQYIGFSKDLRNSLRTVFSRRPDKAHFYKATHLPELDQQQMIVIRDSWYEECGGAPPGNQLVMERTAWQQPVDAGAISQRGKRGAAEEQASQLLKMMRDRGCKEEFVANDELLNEGMVDFLPAAALNDAEIEERKKAAHNMLQVTRVGKAVVDGQEKPFSVHYDRKITTNNGFMMDVTVTYDNQDTVHRIIIGKEYYEPEGTDAEHVIEAALTLLIEQKVPRQTEGLILSSQFPINYFSISEVEQWFGEDFINVYERCTGEKLVAGSVVWRFNRIHTYGPASMDTRPAKTSVGQYL